MNGLEKDWGVFNQLQEDLLEQFIEAGGKLTVYQRGRAEGYSTFAIVQCLQQALTTDRDVVYVYDDKGWTPPEFCRIAMRFFDRGARWNRQSNAITIDDKTIRLFRPERYGDRLRGLAIDDVFGDVDGVTIDKNEEFFYVLADRQGRGLGDGTGLRLMVVR